MVTWPVEHCGASEALEAVKPYESPRVVRTVQYCYSSRTLYIVKC